MKEIGLIGKIPDVSNFLSGQPEKTREIFENYGENIIYENDAVLVSKPQEVIISTAHVIDPYLTLPMPDITYGGYSVIDAQPGLPDYGLAYERNNDDVRISLVGLWKYTIPNDIHSGEEPPFIHAEETLIIRPDQQEFPKGVKKTFSSLLYADSSPKAFARGRGIVFCEEETPYDPRYEAKIEIVRKQLALLPGQEYFVGKP